MEGYRPEELNQAAEQFRRAVEEFTRTVNRLSDREIALERVLRNLPVGTEVVQGAGGSITSWSELASGAMQPGVWAIVRVPEPVSEEEAGALAVRAVREYRQERKEVRKAEAPAPEPEDVAKWDRERHARREEEGPWAF